MNIDFKQPKYIAPLLLLPFLCLFFYVYQSSTSKEVTQKQPVTGLNATVAEVSGDVKKKQLSDKLDAYRNTYKEADGYTAVIPIPKEQAGTATFDNSYSETEKRKLDSIDRAMKIKYATNVVQNPLVNEQRHVDPGDRAMAEALKGLTKRRQQNLAEERQNSHAVKEGDPMDLFKQQMSYMDSMNKANDPAFKTEKLKKEALDKAEQLRTAQHYLKVSKIGEQASGFNTVLPERHSDPIKAIIDENVTGYAGSRIRIRLLDDIMAGKVSVKKGTYLYALINGFSGQRVTLLVTSILVDSQVLPVKLEIYDLDGMPGLYVPESAFRDFTKDLGGNSMQGVNLDGSSGSGNQFLMSSASKIFQSTSSAIAEAIRKNKAKLKYNSCLYLVDNDALQNAPKN